MLRSVGKVGIIPQIIEIIYIRYNTFIPHTVRSSIVRYRAGRDAAQSPLLL